MKSKKILFTLLSCFLVGALVGCSQGSGKTPDTPVDPGGGGDDPVVPPVSDHVYSVKIGSQTVSLTKASNQYEATLSNLVKDASVTFYKDNAEITADIASEQRVGANNLIQGSVGSFYVHNDAASSQLTFKIVGSSYTFWATGYEDDPQPPATVTYSVTVGNGSYTLEVDSSASLAQGQTGQYTVSLNNVQKDEAVVFLKDNQAITENIGSDPESDTSKNLIQGQVGAFVIHNDATTSTLYFKTWESGGYSFWATGYADEPQPPEPPVQQVYTLKVDGGDAITMVDASSQKEETDTWVAQYKGADVALVEGKDLSFYLNGEKLNVGASGEGNNAKYSEGSLTIIQSATADVYLKIYDDEGTPGYDSWVGGYVAPEPPVPGEVNYYIAGSLGGEAWNDKAVKLEEHTYEGEDETVLKEYHAEVTFAQNDKWLVESDEATPNYFKLLEPGVEGMHNDELDNNNIVIDTPDTYDIYFKLYTAESGKSPTIWAKGQTEPQPVEKVYTLKVDGGDAITMEDVSNEKKEGDEWVAQYKGANIALVEGKDLSFYLNDVKINVGASGEGNNAVYEEGNLTIIQTATADVYLKVYDNEGTPGYDSWVGGYVPPEPPVTTVTYSIIGSFTNPEWSLSKKIDLAPHQYEGGDTTVAEEYYVAYTFAQNDEWQIVDDRDTTGYYNILEDVQGMHNDREKNNNIVVDTEGTYDIYFKIYTAESGKSPTIYVAKQGDDPQPPVEKVYTLKVNDGNAITMEDVSNEKKDGDTWVAQYKGANVELLEGKDLSFYLNDVKINVGASGEGNNAEYKDGNLTIIQTATADVYLKVYDNEGTPGYDSWVGGYVAPEPPVPGEVNYYVGGRINGETEWNNQVAKMAVLASEDETVEVQYHAEVAFKAEDQWKVVSDEETAKYYNLLEGGVSGMHVEETGDKNIIVDTAGTYDIYFKIYKDGSGKAPTIYAKAQGDDPQPPVEKVYTLKVNNGDAIEMADATSEKKESDTWVAQFVAKNVELLEGKDLSFYLNGEKINVGASGDGNNAKYNDGNLTIIQTANADVYLKVYADGYDSWVGGYVAPEPEPEQMKTFYLDPGCWNVDRAWFAVYAIDKEGKTAWFKMTQDGDYFTVEIDVAKYVTVIFVRMNPASQEMNWDSKWNQTEDLTIGENNLYSITGWGENGQPSPGAWSTKA